MRILLICAMLIASPAYGGQVFKCKDANGGVIFSPAPCGKGAQEVKLPGSKNDAPAERAPNDGRASPAAVYQLPPAKVDAIRDISDGMDDKHCRDDARNLYVSPNTVSLERAQRELRALEGRSWTGGSAANRQILAETDEAHMASLRGLIATEQQSADSVRAESQRRVDDALAKCDVRQREVLESRKR